jgi:hypothetical protein
MKATSNQMRVTALLLAVLTSAVVLGSTVVGMQAGSASDPTMVVMEKVTIRPSALN